MKKFQAFKNAKKGFTLVEIIVVLVILAILAAIAVPSLVGYIDNAKDKQVVTEARAVFVAAQAVATEAYAQGLKEEGAAEGVITEKTITVEKLNYLIGETLAVDKKYNATATKGKINAFTYIKDKLTVTYDPTNKVFNVTKS